MATLVIWGMETRHAIAPGYTFIFATDTFVERELEQPIEYFFNYDGKDFNLDEAVDKTKYWWKKTFGADGIKVIDKRIVFYRSNRSVMFVVKVIATYEKVI